jgi:ABC-type uncharacterized transport system permease subunit
MILEIILRILLWVLFGIMFLTVVYFGSEVLKEIMAGD